MKTWKNVYFGSLYLFFALKTCDYWSILHLRGYVYIIMVNIFHKETFFSAERDQRRDTVLFPFFNAFCLLYNGYSSIVVAAFFLLILPILVFFVCFVLLCRKLSPYSIFHRMHYALCMAHLHTCTLAHLHNMALYPTASRLGVIGSRDSFKCINVRFIRYKSMLRVANICIHEYFEWYYDTLLEITFFLEDKGM